MRSSRFLTVILVLSTLFQTTNNVQAQHSGSEELRAITWNLYLLPHILKKTGQRERAKYIAETLVNEDYDVLILQEVFDKKSAEILDNGLKEHYPYKVGPANAKGSPFKANSGAMIYCKYPLNLLTEFRFEDCKGVDCWGRKGGVLAEFEKDGQKYQVMSTHLQAFPGVKKDKIRLLQYHQIVRDVVLPYAETNVPQLLGGDYNTLRRDSFYYESMIKVLDGNDGVCSGDVMYTYETSSNDLITKGDYKEFLDYIFVRENGIKFRIQERYIKTFKSDWDTKKKKNRKDLSDHYAIELILKK